MIYEYECNECGVVTEDTTFQPIGGILENCPFCYGAMVRRVSLPQVKPPDAPAYFNHSIGEVVTSTRDFEEKLRVNSDKATQESGVEQRFVPVYPDEGRKHIEKLNGPNVELPA